MPEPMARAHSPAQRVQAGERISRTSLAWTVAAGSTAIVIGLIGNSVVLVAFGLIGLLDAVGSGSLIIHFRHAQRHEQISDRLEAIALRVVTIGMAIIGLATMSDSAYRLRAHSVGHAPAAGVVLAGVSTFVLAMLARRKHKIARHIPSPALQADGWLSAMGAMLAAVTLAGTGMEAAFGWWWLDPVAAVGVGVGAVSLSVALLWSPAP